METTEQQLRDWAAGAWPKAEVFFDGATASEPERQPAIGFRLLRVLPDASACGARNPAPLRIRLGYIATAWAKDPVEMHRILGALAFEAMEMPGWNLDSEQAGPEWWQALGLPLRPSLFVWIPATRERVVRRAPLVRAGLVLSGSPLRPLAGLVLGPGNIPLMDVLVEIPAWKLSTRTGPEGQFQFSAVPANRPVGAIRVHAKGREKVINLERVFACEEPLRIQLSESEI
jgi:hypothetical protein